MCEQWIRFGTRAVVSENWIRYSQSDNGIASFIGTLALGGGDYPWSEHSQPWQGAANA
jgi:hypothetical protein